MTLRSRALELSAALLLSLFNPMQGQNQNGQSQNGAPSGPKADIIFIHANIYTGVPANSAFSSILREEAIAVRGDRILATGKTADLEKFKGPQTQVVDLGGHFVMPGFNDAHLHLEDAGTTQLSVDLTGVKSLDELRARVQKKVEQSKAGDWIVGAGWDETLWPVKAVPLRWDLDEVSAGHPVLLERIDGHIAVANTRALQLGSITLASRDPQGGHIDRNENGEPTGILRETAQAAVRDVIPPATHESGAKPLQPLSQSLQRKALLRRRIAPPRRKPAPPGKIFRSTKN